MVGRRESSGVSGRRSGRCVPGSSRGSVRRAPPAGSPAMNEPCRRSPKPVVCAVGQSRPARRRGAAPTAQPVAGCRRLAWLMSEARTGPVRRPGCGPSWSTRHETGRYLRVPAPRKTLSPFSGPGGMLMGAHDRRIDLGVAVDVGVQFGQGDDVRFQSCPGAVGHPAGEPLMRGLPRPVPLGQIPPRRARALSPADRVDDLPMIMPSAAAPGLRRQQRAPTQPIPRCSDHHAPHRSDDRHP